MKKKTQKTLIASVIAVLALMATAGASVYLTRQSQEPEAKPVAAATTTKTKKTASNNTVRWDNHPSQVQPAAGQQTVNCDDGNIAGKVIGGVGGGVLASNVGKGKGKTAATIGGTLGGAYLGGQYIPTRNVTCR